jgi:hypothetical protein
MYMRNVRTLWSSASDGIARPSTAVGLIWPNPNSEFSPPNASTAAFPTNRPLSREVVAWEQERNANHTKSDWHFTTKDARIKMPCNLTESGD